MAQGTTCEKRHEGRKERYQKKVSRKSHGDPILLTHNRWQPFFSRNLLVILLQNEGKTEIWKRGKINRQKDIVKTMFNVLNHRNWFFDPFSTSLAASCFSEKFQLIEERDILSVLMEREHLYLFYLRWGPRITSEGWTSHFLTSVVTISK